MNKTNTVMLAVFVALGLALVAGLIAIPSIEQAHAAASSSLAGSIEDRLGLFFGLRNAILGLFS
jgi:hypothetical protein